MVTLSSSQRAYVAHLGLTEAKCVRQQLARALGISRAHAPLGDGAGDSVAEALQAPALAAAWHPPRPRWAGAGRTSRPGAHPLTKASVGSKVCSTLK